MSSDEVNTTCPYCGVGCGVAAKFNSDGMLSVSGDEAHPSNLGRVCSKGAALHETVNLEGRLLTPEISGEQVSWDQALTTIAERFSAIIEQHGPDAVAFYVSGQLLTEDYYVANKLMKGFIGSANIDTNSRLCMSSTVAGHKRAFGGDIVPCSYDDLEQANLVVLVGSNTAWCHPVLFRRLTRAVEDNPDLQVVQIDPRQNATTQLADLHLPIKPGSDALLFAGLLSYLEETGEGDDIFLQQSVDGVKETLSAARTTAPHIEQVAQGCEIPEQDLISFYNLFARTERVVTVFSQGINQSSSGTDKVNSIINCHLYTGRIGQPGMGPFSLTGQPNAMGGREVGGLSNQLAAHMELENPTHRKLVQEFWSSPKLPEKSGLKAVDMFRAVEEGGIKALWIMGTNPAVSMPDSSQVRRALSKCEFLVVSDCMSDTDTVNLAQVRLPALTWGERSGTVTNSERRISRQRPFMPSPGEARQDWWIISQVAGYMGFAAHFPYLQPAEIFREHAALSAWGNNDDRAFNIGVLSTISDKDYAAMKPMQWPISDQAPYGTQRMFVDGKYFTSNRRARMVTVKQRPPAHSTNREWPLVLNTGRVRDHWHTMTRTGKSSRLASHTIEPYAEMHPADAHRYRLTEGALARVTTTLGQIIVRIQVTGGQRPGSIFVPMHWNDQFTVNGCVNRLVISETDPLSGQPESKHMPARVEPYAPSWYGFMFSRRLLQPDNLSYWSRSRGDGYWRYEIAGELLPDDWAGAARNWLCEETEQVDWVEYFDHSAQRYRAARFVDGILESSVFIGPDINLPPRDWIGHMFAQENINAAERASLLSGIAPAGGEDIGRIICACNRVGEKRILEGIMDQGLDTVEQIGECLGAGTNCGSCIPDIKGLLTACLETA